MQLGANGLLAVASSDLEKLLRALHRGDVTCPLTIQDLTRVGLQHAADRLGHLRGLTDAGVRAVVVAVIAERREVERRLAASRDR